LLSICDSGDASDGELEYAVVKRFCPGTAEGGFMRRIVYVTAVALIGLAVIAAPVFAAQGKGAGKGKGGGKSATTQTERGASGQSAHATGSRSTERAREGQVLGQGQEHRGFEQPKGLEKKGTTTSATTTGGDTTKAKGKGKRKAKAKGHAKKG